MSPFRFQFLINETSTWYVDLAMAKYGRSLSSNHVYYSMVQKELDESYEAFYYRMCNVLYDATPAGSPWWKDGFISRVMIDHELTMLKIHANCGHGNDYVFTIDFGNNTIDQQQL